MEVHHHSHTARKSFKHYSFEFFMLFFAVFCGFLAEYFLEYRIERHREHEFIESMVMDLREDTSKITPMLRYNQSQAKSLDSLSYILYNHIGNPDSIQKAYELYASYALNYNDVTFSDRTIAQLKNSGGLRLIKNQNVSDSIMDYDKGIAICKSQFEVIKNLWNVQSNTSYGIFDLGYLHSMRRTHEAPSILLPSSKKEVSIYCGQLTLFSGLVSNYAFMIQYQKEKATRLIDFLKKEYDLN